MHDIWYMIYMITGFMLPDPYYMVLYMVHDKYYNIW